MVNENNKSRQFKDEVTISVEKMCRLFWGPDLESCAQMMEPHFFESFEALFKEVKSEPLMITGQIRSIVHTFDTVQAFYDHLNQCYVTLFVNSREGILAPLYESCYAYENAPMMGKAAVEMTQRFTSKGLSMENIVHEPPDHLAVELEYLFFLLQEKEELISKEAAAFAGDIMLPWVKIFNQRLEQVDEDCRFYSFAAGILVLLLQQISNPE